MEIIYFNIIKKWGIFLTIYEFLYLLNPNPMSIFVSRNRKPSIIRKKKLKFPDCRRFPMAADENGYRI